MPSLFDAVAGRQRRLGPWFAQQQVRLWAAETARLDRELTRLEGLLTQHETAYDAADEQRIRLAGQIENDQIGRELNHYGLEAHRFYATGMKFLAQDNIVVVFVGGFSVMF